MTAAVFITDRLVLRQNLLADFESLYALLESDRTQFLGGPFKQKWGWQWIISEVGSWSLKGFSTWCVELREEGRFLGQLGINQPEDFHDLKVGWIFRTLAEAKDYAFEAANATLNWARNILKPVTLVSYIGNGNRCSIALEKNLGAMLYENAQLPRGDTSQNAMVYRHLVRGHACL